MPGDIHHWNVCRVTVEIHPAVITTPICWQVCSVVKEKKEEDEELVHHDDEAPEVAVEIAGEAATVEDQIVIMNVIADNLKPMHHHP